MPITDKLLEELNQRKPEALKELRRTIKTISNLKGTMPYNRLANLYNYYQEYYKSSSHSS